jgi:hypothetical protein
MCSIVFSWQTISNLGSHIDYSVIYIIISGIGSCLNISSSVPLYQLMNNIRIADGSVFPMPNGNINYALIVNVSIPDAPVSVATYETMLSDCVTSGRYTSYIQSAAAVTPNASALLQASSSSVAFGEGKL